MTGLLNHKGYAGTVEADIEDDCLYGSVLHVNDCIVYQGKTIEELKSSFVSAVDEYLLTCEELGKSPDKPCSGTFNIRIDPELHKQLSLKAVEECVSLNSIASKAISEYVQSKRVHQTLIHKHSIELNYRLEDQREPYSFPELANVDLEVLN